MNQHVETLLAQAVKADRADEAMKFAQAALNAAQAVHTAKNAEKL